MRILITILGLITSISFANATTYYTYYVSGSTNWGTASIWSTSTDSGPGVTWGSLTIMSGDIIVIDDDITLTGSELTINVDVTIILDANLDISKKLNLTTDSTIEFTENGNVTGSGPGNSEKIRIGSGNNVWSGNDGTITGPGTLDKNSSGGSLMPVELVFFNARSNNFHIELNWATASEENNDYFTIERSANGMDYHELNKVEGAGNNFSTLNYNYIDKMPLAGVSYYRLKQTDYDGESETFNPVVVEYYGETSQISIHQQLSNPNELTIINNMDEENTAMIYDIMGKAVGEISLTQGNNTIELTGRRKGLYHVRIFNAIGRVLKTEKIIIR